MRKLLSSIIKISKNVIVIVTTLIFSIMLVLFAMATEKIILVIFAVIFAFTLTGTTLIDIFKKRNFSKLYNIITSVVMLIMLITMLRPILDVIYIKYLFISNFDYFYSNWLILFYQNLFVYIIIFVLIFVGNYINYKI